MKNRVWSVHYDLTARGGRYTAVCWCGWESRPRKSFGGVLSDLAKHRVTQGGAHDERTKKEAMKNAR